MEQSKTVCEEKHKAVEKELAQHSAWLNNHERKIDRLETSDAANTMQIGNLAQSLDKQTKAIWGLVGTVAITLIGAGISFIVWYIQNL